MTKMKSSKYASLPFRMFLCTSNLCMMHKVNVYLIFVISSQERERYSASDCATLNKSQNAEKSAER